MKRFIVVLCFLVAFVGSIATVDAAVPAQYIAKQYSEALGRIPDQGGWQSYVTLFTQCGCNKSCLKNYGRGFFLSTEYANLRYSNEEKVLTLYRAILNREPDSSGYNWYLSQLNAGVPLGNIVDSFFDSSEFASLVPGICNGGSYGWGNAPAINIPVKPGGFQGGSGQQLQALLNRAASGSTVWLAQRSVTRINTTLVIPSGVTLATYGNPSHNKYAKMARLVRASNFGAPLILISPGATNSKLKNVWIDGQRNVTGIYPHFDDLNVKVMGGSGIQVVNNRISGSAGWSSLQLWGSNESAPCGGNLISSNLITSYASSHYWVDTGGDPVWWGGWSDGISIACENSIVEYNQIIDATDVALVVFRATPATQRSIVRYNTILNAGNSAYGGIGIDPITLDACYLCPPNTSPDFTGSSVENNTIWTGPDVHYDILFYLGSMAWFESQGGLIGTGARLFGNTTGSQTVRANTGIVVDGMRNATVLNNTVNVQLIDTQNPGGCPVALIAADISGGHASGTIQQPYNDIAVHNCIGH